MHHDRYAPAGCCSSEVRDTTAGEAGERGCESLPRVVKSREPLRRRRKTKERKKPKGQKKTRPLVVASETEEDTKRYGTSNSVYP